MATFTLWDGLEYSHEWSQWDWEKLYLGRVQLLLKANSDAHGHLQVGGNQLLSWSEMQSFHGRKSSYSAPADPSPAPASLSLCPEGPSPAGVPVVSLTFRLPHLLLNPPLPLCHAPTHRLGLWEICVCTYFFQAHNIFLVTFVSVFLIPSPYQFGWEHGIFRELIQFHLLKTLKSLMLLACVGYIQHNCLNPNI